MDISRLMEIGEYAAAGYYTGVQGGLPYPREYGLAYRFLYENSKVRICDGRLLFPCEPLFEAVACEGERSMSGGVHHPLNMIFNRFHSDGFEVSRVIAKRKAERFPEHADFIAELEADLRSRRFARGGYIHSNPDIYTVLKYGFNHIKKQLAESLAAADNDAERSLLLALGDCADGIDAYFATVKEALRKAVGDSSGERKAELAFIEREFSGCFYEPATSFTGGLLSVNLLWMLDGCDSIGRFDYALGELFERDIESGAITLDFARRLLDDFWRSYENMNGWNLVVGGRTPDGGSCYNRLTRECLLCDARLHVRRPNLALRVTPDMPDDVWKLALDCIASGTGKPALYNDDLYISQLMRLMPDIPYEDAAAYAFGGCTETMLPGISCVDSKLGNINFAELLRTFLFLRCEDEPDAFRFCKYPDFDSLINAFKEYIALRTKQKTDVFEKMILGNLTEVDPKLMRTLFTADCVARRRSFEDGGARYNWSVVSYDGTTTVADGLSAIKARVFDERSISPETLLKALESNFEGYEAVERSLNSAPKFGNGLLENDALCTEPLAFAWKELLKYRVPRGEGGRYLPSIILFSTYHETGRNIGATPDGRRAGEPLNDSIGAYRGNDVNGPTALINSVLQIPLELAAGTPVFNIRLGKGLVCGEGGYNAVRTLCESFFAGGGMQLQFTVQSSEDMRAAQLEPEKYRNLIVRIGGYSEYFNYLTKTLQDTVISRSEAK